MPSVLKMQSNQCELFVEKKERKARDERKKEKMDRQRQRKVKGSSDKKRKTQRKEK